MSSQSSSSVTKQREGHYIVQNTSQRVEKQVEPRQHSKLKQKIFTVINQNQQEFFEQNYEYFIKQADPTKEKEQEAGHQMNQKYRQFERNLHGKQNFLSQPVSRTGAASS